MALLRQGRQQLAAAIVCLSLSIVAVAIRFWCKLIAKTGLHWDDWWILAAVLTFCGGQSANIWGIITGAGGLELPQLVVQLAKAPSLEKLGELENYLESLFLSATFTFVVLYACKLSILVLYRRIFSTRRYRIASAVLMGVSSMWFIAAFVTDMAFCIPTDHFWHRTKPGHCLNFNLFFAIININEIVLDTAILIIPTWGVVPLQMSARTRAIVLGIFLVGFFSIVTNIIRVYYSYQPNVEYVAFNSSALWGNIHIATTIICSCLPVYSPLRSHAGILFESLRNRFGSSCRSVFIRSKSKVYAHQNDSLELFGYPEQPSVDGVMPKSEVLVTNVVSVHQNEAAKTTRVPTENKSMASRGERIVEIV